MKAGTNESLSIVAAANKETDITRKTMNEMPATLYDMMILYEKEKERHQDHLTRFYGAHDGIPQIDWLGRIVLSTDMFIVRDASLGRRSIIAGYHWFETWGRDTFISLPGLMLVEGRFDEARKVFLSFIGQCNYGLIPNFMPDRPALLAYNSVDATLWYVHSVLQYLKYTCDFSFVQEELWEALKTVVENHVKGTVFSIHVDSDGLLSHGPQLTWMDATVDCQPVTPRVGKAVEIQALWYNALKTMELLARRFKANSEADRYAEMAEVARKSFAEKFWNGEKDCLFDVIGDDGKDSSIRPNQILAVALDFTMLDNAKNKGIVDLVHRELVTPCGLRTLARSDAKYHGAYSGDRRSRDMSYHNGTVWPWLIGPFISAFLRTGENSGFNRDYAMKSFLSPLLTKHTLEAGLGTISEIFDGESPHTPRGCIAQAWSVAEPLRSYVEDIMQVRPKYEKEVLQGSS